MAAHTEADTCRKYFLPKLCAAGWTDDQINGREADRTAVKVVARSGLVAPVMNVCSYEIESGCDFWYKLGGLKALLK
jgi:hypothetical protein